MRSPFVAPLFIALSCVFAVSATAEEKIQPTVDSAAPGKSVEDKKAASNQRRQSAEWIKRCDKREGDKRMACLDEVRAEVVQRFDDDGAVVNAEGDKEQ